MSDDHSKIDEFMSRELGPEITHEEALKFLMACPYGKKVASALMTGYIIRALVAESPYHALSETLKTFVDAIDEVKRIHGE